MKGQIGENNAAYFRMSDNAEEKILLSIYSLHVSIKVLVRSPKWNNVQYLNGWLLGNTSGSKFRSAGDDTEWETGERSTNSSRVLW